jgi:hypothetical protein
MSIRTQQATQMISQCRPNDTVDIPNPSNRITQGVTFSAVANKLIKSGPDGLFISKGVQPGDIALNVNSGFYTTVVTVESESSLLLASNIFSVANQAFAVFRSIPNGGYPWTPCIRIIIFGALPYNVNLITAGGDNIIFTTTGFLSVNTLGSIQVSRVLATGTDAGLIFAAFQ